MDTEDFERNSNEMILILQPDLRYRQRVHNVQTAAVVSMMKKGIFSATQATVINSLVKIFDARLTELVSECPSTTESLYLNCARVQIQAFYFFAKSDSLDIVGLTELYSIAQALVNDATVLGELDQLAAVCSTYICRSISLAAFSILKISKSSLSSFLDFRTGERAYFAAIRFLKKASLENDDLSAKAAAILTQLWTSDRVFKRADGEIESLTLRIRSRSSMSVVFDCIWWWREEFGGQTSPFSDMTAPAKEDVAFNEPIAGVHGPEYTLGMIDDAPLTEFPPVEYLPDYDWVASLTFPPGNMGLPNVDI
jgi:transcriptional regulatory protein LEU3